MGEIIGEDLISELESSSEESAVDMSVKKCFSALMTCDPSVVKDKQNSLIRRFTDLGQLISLHRSEIS